MTKYGIDLGSSILRLRRTEGVPHDLSWVCVERDSVARESGETGVSQRTRCLREEKYFLRKPTREKRVGEVSTRTGSLFPYLRVGWRS